MIGSRSLYVLFLSLLLFLLCFSPCIKACKDIVACGDATEGDYNILMKVRDPSRPGLQVLCIVPEGYEYTYHKAWTGKDMTFVNRFKYIGVASLGDSIPNIVKAGMTLSSTGISYGDSDSNSRWINPTKNAWDDFDWIRYAAENAETVDDAVNLLTKDVVDKYHATGVTENLFVVGPDKGYVVEADAFRYKTNEITDGFEVMHNYPKMLWKSQLVNMRPISKDFDTTVNKYVKAKQVIRLGSLYAIKIDEINSDHIIVKPYGLFHKIATRVKDVVSKINIGEGQVIGEFYVELLELSGNTAKVHVTNIYHAWEEKMYEIINQRYGKITVEDMINWSRLTKEELDGLRGICQKSIKNEAVAIYKIPKENYDLLSMGWFSANKASSSIYVPFHISNTDIFDSYENGEAAQLSLDLIDLYEPDILIENFSRVETVFLHEIAEVELASKDYIKNEEVVSEFLTIIDTSIQKQAYLTQSLWKQSYDVNKAEITEIISKIWSKDNSVSLLKMKDAILELKDIGNSKYFSDTIEEILFEITNSRIHAVESLGLDVEEIHHDYEGGLELLNSDNLEEGYDRIINSYNHANAELFGETVDHNHHEEHDESERGFFFLYFLISIILGCIILIIITKPKK